MMTVLSVIYRELNNNPAFPLMSPVEQFLLLQSVWENVFISQGILVSVLYKHTFWQQCQSWKNVHQVHV